MSTPPHPQQSRQDRLARRGRIAARILTRRRLGQRWCIAVAPFADAISEFHDEVAELDAEIARLREALGQIAEPTVCDPIHREYAAVKRLRDIALAALTGKEKPDA